MRPRQCRINGINVFFEGNRRYQNFIKPDAITIVNMTLYFLKDLAWIDEISIFPGELGLEIFCDVKENFEMDYVRKVMKESMILITNHIKEFELETAFYVRVNSRYVRIVYWEYQSQVVMKKLGGKGWFKCH